MVGAWGHALGWRRGTYERDELFKLRFRGLRAWARREFDRVVAANRSDDEKENETIKLQVASAFYNCVYHPEPNDLLGKRSLDDAVDSKDTLVDDLRDNSGKRLLSFAWVAHKELLSCTQVESVAATPEDAAEVECLSRALFGETVASEKKESRPSLLWTTRSESSKMTLDSLLAKAPVEELGGYLFRCNNQTYTECLRRGLFGDTGGHQQKVEAGIVPGKTKLFLFNTSRRVIHGPWIAASTGGFREKTAWDACRKRDRDGRIYSAQVAIEEIDDEPLFAIPQGVADAVLPIMRNHPLKWYRKELNEKETNDLLRVGRRHARRKGRAPARDLRERIDQRRRRDSPRRSRSPLRSRGRSRSRESSRDRSIDRDPPRRRTSPSPPRARSRSAPRGRDRFFSMSRSSDRSLDEFGRRPRSRSHSDSRSRSDSRSPSPDGRSRGDRRRRSRSSSLSSSRSSSEPAPARKRPVAFLRDKVKSALRPSKHLSAAKQATFDGLRRGLRKARRKGHRGGRGRK